MSFANSEKYNSFVLKGLENWSLGPNEAHQYLMLTTVGKGLGDRKQDEYAVLPTVFPVKGVI